MTKTLTKILQFFIAAILSLNANQVFSQATGGIITNYSNYSVHTFTSTGVFYTPVALNVEYLIVAGGGGGGATSGPICLAGGCGHYNGGGGGAGGMRTGTLAIPANSTYTVTVGAGGNSVTIGNGGNGGSSSFATITSAGGGGGGAYGAVGNAGGSSGGTGRDQSNFTLGNNPATSPSQGNNGAVQGGGGGGAGASAFDRDGGAGAPSFITGTLTYYAGGGGGAQIGATANSIGGIGGGGAGRNSHDYPGNGTSGTPNTGGGGGAAGVGWASGEGGSGIVILRYSNGEALDFDGINDKVVIGSSINAVFTATNTITLEAWVKPAQTYFSGVIVGNYANPSGDMQFLLRHEGDQFTFWVDPGTGYTSVYSGASTATANIWQHVAGVWDGSEMRIYVNGILKATHSNVTGPGFPIRNNSVVIGGDSLNENFTGSIDELRIWKTARTQCEINTFLNCEIPTSASNLVANYHFNQGNFAGANASVTLLADASGNAYNGILTNFSLTGATSNWLVPGGVISGSNIPLPSLVIGVISSNPLSCIGNTVTLNGTGADTYSWTGGVTDNVPFSPTITSSYSVTGTSTLTTCSNTAVSSIAVVSCSPASALNFDGINDRVTIGNSMNQIFDSLNVITLEAWVKPTTNTGYGMIVGNHQTTGSLQLQFMLRRDFNNYSFYVTDNNGIHSVSSAANVTVNVWQHVAGVWDGSVMRIYINGVLSGTLSGINGSSFSSSDKEVWIGRNSNELFTGDIDEVRIWTVPRSQCEILSFMNCEIPNVYPDLLANYHFNQGTAVSPNPTITTLFDASGNSYHGSLLDFSLTGLTSNWSNPGAVVSSYTTPAFLSVVGSTISNSVICLGESVTLNGTGGSNTYTWSGGVVNNVPFSPTVTSSYTVTGTNTVDICNTSVQTITVNPVPNVIVNSGIICSGNSFTISPSGANTYTISGGSAIVNPNVTTSYSIFGTSSLGCVSPGPAIATVSVNPSPTLVVNSGSICAGNSFTIIPNGADTYTISGGSAMVSPTITSSYSITGENAGGCLAANAAIATVIVVNAVLPSVTVNSGVMCVGDSFTIIPSGATSYTFSSGSPIVTPVASNTFAVIGTNSLGCYGTAVSSVSVSNCLGGSGCLGLQLPKNNDYIIFPSPFYSYSNAITVEAWVYIDSTVSAYPWITQTTEGVNDGKTNVWMWHHGNSNSINWYVNDSVYSWNTVSSSVLPSGWHHIATVANSSVSQIFVDGILNASGSGITTSIPSNTSSVIHLGHDGRYPDDTSDYRNGDFKISELRVWSLARTQAEIQTYSVSCLTPTVSGLVLYNQFGDGAGSNSVTSMIGPNGILQHMDSIADWVEGSGKECCTGAVAAALKFDGVNDRINLGNSISTLFNPLNVITVEAWVNPTSVAGNGAIVGNYNSPSQMQFLLRRDGNRYAFLVKEGPGNSVVQSAVGTVTLNTWQHVAGVWDGSQIRIYINGELRGTTSGVNGSDFSNTSNNVGIGHTMGSEHFAGSIDEVRIWNQALSQCQIASFRGAEIPNPTPGLIANYHFNQGLNAKNNSSVTTLIDASGSSRTGTLSNFALNGFTSNWLTPGGVTTYSTGSLPIVVGASVTNSVVCLGASTKLNGTGAHVYSWTGGISNNVIFTPTLTTTYTVTGTNTLSSCTSTAAITVSVNPASSITIGAISGASLVCPGNVKTYSIAPVVGILSHKWTVPSGWTGTNTTNIVSLTAGLSSGIINLTPIYSCGAGISQTKSVTAKPSPTIAVSSGAICEGNSFTLVPSGALTYTFSGGSSAVSPTLTTTYSVTGTNSLGCESLNPAISTVSVKPAPLVYVNSGGLCSNLGSGSFTIFPSGANIYTISGGSYIVSPLVSTNYTVTGTGSNGCKNALPAISSVSVGNCKLVSGCLGVDMPRKTDYIKFTNPYYNFNKAITVEAWVYLNGENSSGPGMGQGTAGVDNELSNVWLWHPSSGNQINWHVNYDGNFNSVATGALDNGWHHIATVADTVSLRIYVDGVLNAEGGQGITNTIKNNPLSELHIGHDVRYPNDTNSYFSDYKISELRIWNVARTEQQIQTFSNSCLTSTTSGLVLYNQFEDGIGSNIATSLIGPKGILYNVNATSDWVLGSEMDCCAPPASALNFDGSNDRVNLGNSISALFNPLNKITLEAWVKPTSAFGNGAIVGNYNSNNHTQFLLRRDGNRYAFMVNDGTGNKTVQTSAGTATTNVWQHVAGVWDGSQIRIYINGILKGATTGVTGSSFANTSNNVGIGHSLNSQHFNGSIDEVRIWSVARSQCDINTFRNGEIADSSLGLVANYHFNQGHPATANPYVTNLTDASGNAHTGTLTGFALTGTVSNWVTPGGVISGSSNSLSPLAIGATVTNSVICLGASTQLNGTGAHVYSWTGGRINNVPFSPTQSASYTVTGTNTLSACTNTAAISITVNPASTISIGAISGNTLICPYETQTYSVASIGGVFNYNWSAPNGWTGNSNTNTIAITASLNGGNITVTPYYSCGAGIARTIAVSAKESPSITVNSGIICTGESFTLIPAGANNYTYSSGSAVISPTITSTYTVSTTNTLGCIGSAVSTVTVSSCEFSTGCFGLQLPDTADYIKFSSPYYSYNKELTVEAWIYLDSTANSTPWMGQGTYNVDDMADNVWLWHSNGINSLAWLVNDNGTWQSATSTALSNGWHHIATTADTTGLKVYVDGILNASGNPIESNILNNSGSEINIGHDVRWPLESGFRNGDFKISEFRVWNTARTQLEVQTYSAACINPTESGLVLYNQFDDGSGISIATSIVGPNGTLENMDNIADWVDGSGIECCSTSPLAVALNFDGTNDEINLGNSLSSIFDPLNKITLEAWVKPTTTSGDGAIIGNYNSANQMQFLLRRNGNRYSFLVKEGPGNNAVQSAVSTVTINTWQHVAGVWDGSQIRIYINGVLKGTTNGVNGANFSSSSNNVGIGHTMGSQRFSGSIDELRIWSRARTACEINNFMNSEIPNSSFGLVANYHFNQGFNAAPNQFRTTLNDASGNSYNGTLTGFALTGSVSNWIAPGGVIPNSQISDTCNMVGARMFNSNGEEINTDISGSIESENTPLIGIYPNPSNGLFTISLSKVQKNMSLSVYDLLGELLYQSPLEKELSQLNIKNFNNGIYFLRIEQNGELIKLEKVVKTE